MLTHRYLHVFVHFVSPSNHTVKHALIVATCNSNVPKFKIEDHVLLKPRGEMHFIVKVLTRSEPRGEILF